MEETVTICPRRFSSIEGKNSLRIQKLDMTFVSMVLAISAAVSSVMGRPLRTPVLLIRIVGVPCRCRMLRATGTRLVYLDTSQL